MFTKGNLTTLSDFLDVMDDLYEAHAAGTTRMHPALHSCPLATQLDFFIVRLRRH